MSDPKKLSTEALLEWIDRLAVCGSHAVAPVSMPLGNTSHTVL